MSSEHARLWAILPNGKPRHIRAYLADDGTYIVVFTRRKSHGCPYARFELLSDGRLLRYRLFQNNQVPIDVNANGWATQIGRKCDLGMRIPRSGLPAAICPEVLRIYKELWNLGS